MPRGEPKRGQLDCQLWFPEGGRYRMYTDRNLTFEEWTRQLQQLQETIAAFLARRKDPSCPPQ